MTDSLETIFITGCSTGFGLDIAKHFLARDWKVIATMRTPQQNLLPESEHLKILAVDVTDEKSIKDAVAAAGPIDVLVNNAGFGGASPAELTPMTTLREIFETNTFGTIAVTQAVLPQFRQRSSGVVINVTSSVTYRALPLLSAYRASKSAVNAYTECLALEMQQFNVRVHLVLPGRAPDTSFGTNARQRMSGLDHQAYAEFCNAIIARMLDSAGPITKSHDVSEAVWRAATDAAAPLKIAAGEDAEQWAAAA